MTPALRGSACILLLAVGAAALSAALLYSAGPLLAAPTFAPIMLMLMGLLAGAGVAYCVEAGPRPVDRYRRRHRRLAGPRPGARLG